MLSKKTFIKINTITLTSVYVLIFIGGLVRTLGAGMGCPDWPKCFGEYVPPTSDTELPVDYQEIFKDKRINKNLRLAKVFSNLGFEGIAKKIISDPKINEEHKFNLSKAWVEYVNRLVGVLVGLFVLLNMVLSFSFKKKPIIPILAIAVFIFTGFQGWVGSLVVSTNLLSGFISFHMVLALVIVSFLILLHKLASGYVVINNRNLFILMSIFCVMLLPQIIMGTEVRGMVDELIHRNIVRTEWLNEFGKIFYIHRSYSWLILLIIGIAFFLVIKQKITILYTPFIVLLCLVLVEIGIGVGMNYFNFPFWLQPIHLLVGAGLYGITFYSLLKLRFV